VKDLLELLDREAFQTTRELEHDEVSRDVNSDRKLVRPQRTPPLI
jgi:hypothetical protein